MPERVTIQQVEQVLPFGAIARWPPGSDYYPAKATCLPGEGRYLDPPAILALVNEDCGTCGGKCVVDENGNPYMWGRADSYECAVCNGTGSAHPELYELVWKQIDAQHA